MHLAFYMLLAMSGTLAGVMTSQEIGRRLLQERVRVFLQARGMAVLIVLHLAGTVAAMVTLACHGWMLDMCVIYGEGTFQQGLRHLLGFLFATAGAVVIGAYHAVVDHLYTHFFVRMSQWHPDARPGALYRGVLASLLTAPGVALLVGLAMLDWVRL